jgi:uncharacterized protein
VDSRSPHAFFVKNPRNFFFVALHEGEFSKFLFCGILYIMDNKEIIKKTEEFVKSKLCGEGTGHDWWHTLRVWKLAKKIAEEEGADLFVVEISSLLHDIADWKFQDGGNDSVGAIITKEWLESFNVDNKTISHICNIVKGVSFKGANVKNEIDSIEGMVVQDADRLDAMGAIGISRCFAYGGSKGRPIHDPERKAIKHNSFEEYKNSNSPSINHFYEKLLLLKEKMNTSTGRRIAEERHQFMEIYLERFFKEWEGEI